MSALVLKPQHRRRPGFTLIELLFVMAMITVLIALLLPAIQQSREAARRTQCKNNLMQIGVALHNYMMAHEMLPPGSQNNTGPIRSREGDGYHIGWLTQILPHLEQQNTYDRIDFTKSVYDPVNFAVRQYSIDTLLCPTDVSARIGSLYGVTNYYGVHNDFETPIDVNQNGVLFLNSSIRYEQICDGSSNTIFVMESIVEPGSGSLGWMTGTRSSLKNVGSGRPNVGWGGGAQSGSPQRRSILENDVAALRKTIAKMDAGEEVVGSGSSRHTGGSFHLLGDGAVRFISNNVGLQIYRNLANRADGEMANGDY